MCFDETDIVSLQKLLERRKKIEYGNSRYQKKHPHSRS